MRQFYLPALTQDNTQFTLPVEESKHISRVLRMRVDDEIQLLNGKGLVATARITDNNPKATEVVIILQKYILYPKKKYTLPLLPQRTTTE